MKLSARSTVLYSACITGALMLSACGKNEPAANPPAASSTAAAPAATTPPPASTVAAPAKPSTVVAPASTAQPAAVATTPSASTAAPAADQAFKVHSVTLGDAVTADHKVSKAKSSFPSNTKAIYASVATEGSTSGATLSAKWSYLEGKGQLVTNISQRVDADGPAITAFTLKNPNAWPEGKYKVEISLDGKSVASENFEIKKR